MRSILSQIKSIIEQINDYASPEFTHFWKSRQGKFFATVLVTLVVCTAPLALVYQIALVYCSAQVFILMDSIYRNRSASKAKLKQRVSTIFMILTAIYTASPFILALTNIFICLSHTMRTESWKNQSLNTLQWHFFQKKNAINFLALVRSSLNAFNAATKQVFSYEVLETPYFWKSTQGVYFFITSVSLILLLTVSPYSLISKLVVAHCSERTFHLVHTMLKNRTESKVLLWKMLPRTLLLLSAIYTFSPLILSLTSFSVFLSHTKLSKLWEKYLPQKFSDKESKVKDDPVQPLNSEAASPERTPPAKRQGINGEESPGQSGFGNATIVREELSATIDHIPPLPEKANHELSHSSTL